MSRQQLHRITPILSISIIVFSLFLMVFLKMDLRRMGYVVWKQSREHKATLDQHRVLATEYAKVIRPGHLQEVAVNTLTLSEPRSGQIIHMSGDRVALKQ